MHELTHIYSAVVCEENLIEDWFFMEPNIKDIDAWIKALLVLEMDLKRKGYISIECVGNNGLEESISSRSHINLMVVARIPVDETTKQRHYLNARERFLEEKEKFPNLNFAYFEMQARSRIVIFEKYP